MKDSELQGFRETKQKSIFSFSDGETVCCERFVLSHARVKPSLDELLTCTITASRGTFNDILGNPGESARLATPSDQDG